MSDLSAQLSAFKGRYKSAHQVAVRRTVTPRPEERPKRPPEETLAQAIKKHKTPAIAGTHMSTRLHLAVEHIKQQDRPVPVSELGAFIGDDESMLPLLKEHDRIKYNADSDTVQYMLLHNIRLAEDLLKYLRLQATFKGISVKELKDGWANCSEVICELEEEGKVLVMRSKKENLPRLVWANRGGDIGTIDADFVAMWAKTKLPDRDSIYQALVDQLLKPTGADPHVITKKQVQQQKKQKKVRRGKVTNTHMKGMLKDYSQLV